ncbi:MAG: AsmA family protein, partial [Candidatus Methylomirabilales bacterium]
MGVNRGVRRVILTIGIVVGLILVLFVSLSLLVRIPPVQKQIRSRLESEVQAQLDREVRIGGVHLGFLLSSLDIRDVHIASQKRLEDGVLAEVQAVEIYPNLAELLRFRLSLGRIVVRRPTVNLPPPAAEPAAPTPAQPSAPAPSIPPTLPLGIQHVEIRDGSVTWKGSGIQVTVAGLNVDVQAPAGGIEAKLGIEQSKIEVGTTPLSLRDLVLKAAVDKGDIQVRQFQVTAQGADVQVTGTLSSVLADPTVDLTLRVQGELGGLFPRAPPFPLRGTLLLEGKATGPLADPAFTGQATVGSGEIKQVALSGMSVAIHANRREVRLKELTLKTASGDLTGDVAVTLDKLRYRLALRGEQVDLADILRVVTGDAPIGGQATVRVEAKGEGTDLTKAKGQASIRVKEFHLVEHPKERGQVRIVLEPRDGVVHVRQANVDIARASLRTTGVVKLGGDMNLGVHVQFRELKRTGILWGTDPDELDGQAVLEGRLTGSLANPVLRANLDWTQVTLLEVALDSVRGPLEVAFARRTLTAPTLTVLRQNIRGLLHAVLILGPKPPDRKLLLKYDLTLDINGDVEGPLEQFVGIFAKGPVPLSGPMQLKAQVNGTPETLRGQAALGLTDVVILDEPWEQGHATVELQLQQKKVWLKGLELQRGSEKVAGQFEFGFDGVAQWSLSSNSLAIQHLAILKESGLTGTLQIPSLKGEGPIGKPRVAAELDVGDLGYRGVSLGAGQGNLTWEGSRDRLKVLLSVPERGYTLRMDLTTTAPHPYELDLTLDKGDLWSLLQIVQGPLPTQVSAVGSGRIDVGGRLGEKAPERATVDLEKAQVDVEGHSFKSPGRTHLTFQEGQLTISGLSLAGEGGTVTAEGTIGEEADLTIQGTAPLVLATVVSPAIRDATGLLDVDVKIQGPEQLRQIRGHVRTKDSSLTFRVHHEPLKDLAGEI